MNARKINPLAGVLLCIVSLLLIISGLFGNLAFTGIHVDRLQLTNNGVVISALFMYPSDLESQRPAILAYHGWGGTKENILTNCLDFVKAGFVVLVPDLRGHGESGGISTLGLLEQTDATIAIDYLFSQSDLVNSSAIAVWGASYGGMISLLAAGTDPRITAAIAISAPANTSAWLKERDFRTNERISYRPYTKVDPSNLSAIEERSPINYVNNIENLLVMHGELDPLVPVHHAKDLLKVSNNSNHKLIVFKGEEHNVNGDRVKQETTQFLKDVFKNPLTTIISPPSRSYLFLMACWIALFLSGLLFTLTVLSYFPMIHQKLLSQWDLQKPSIHSSFNKSLYWNLSLILISFIFLHIASVLISLAVVLHYSTILGLILSTISTLGLVIVVNHIKGRKFFPPDWKTVKKWILETGISLLIVLIIYFSLILFAEHPWIPFINLETVFRLSPILIGIGIFLGVESLFYWELIHQFVINLNKSDKQLWYILRMALIYLSSKCVLLFSLIIWWNLFELRFIVYGLGLFGLLGTINAFIRMKWGYYPTFIFTVLTGLTIYSVFSVLFLLL